MTVAKNVYALTAPGAGFPEYISVNQQPYNAPGTLTFTVRSAGAPEGSGYSGEITLDRQQARELGLALIQATN